MQSLTYKVDGVFHTVCLSPRGILVDKKPDPRLALPLSAFLAIDKWNYDCRMIETGSHERSIFAARYRYLAYEHHGIGCNYVSACIFFTILDLMRFEGLTGGTLEYSSQTNEIKYGKTIAKLPFPEKSRPELDVVENVVRDLIHKWRPSLSLED